MVNKAWINYWVDAALTVSFLLCSLTGIVKWPGLIELLGLSYSDVPLASLTTVHDFSGLALVILVAIHLVLHWRWIVMMTKKLVVKK